MLASDSLDSPDFNVTEWINKKFPTEESLVNVDEEVENIRSEIKRLDEQIVLEVSQQSKLGESGREALISANQTVGGLIEKIREIKKKATEAEMMVHEITDDIQDLDIAKTNLTATIRALTQLNNIVTRIDQVKQMVSTHQYDDVAGSIESINDMLALFDEYKQIPKISKLHNETEQLSKDLKNQIFSELFQDVSQLSTKERKNLASAATILDVMGQRMEFVKEFRDRQYVAYDMEFVNGGEFSKLEHSEKRYSWLMNVVTQYNRDYHDIIPVEWNVAGALVEGICIKTRTALLNLMNSQKSTLEPPVLKRALRKTMIFEKELVNIFGEGLGEDDIKSLQKKYNGIISSVYDDFMFINTQQQDNSMQKMFTQVIQEETWKINKSKVFDSAGIIVYHFAKSRQELVSCTTGVGFFDLFTLFQKYLGKYCTYLQSKLKSISESNKDEEQSLKTLCGILNTAEYCCTTTVDVETSIKQSIDERFKEKITLKGIIDSYENLMAATKEQLVNRAQLRLSSCFAALSSSDWGNINTIGDQSNFITMIEKDLQTLTELFKEDIVSQHISDFNFALAIMIIKSFDTQIHQIRDISELGGEQLLLDTKLLRGILIKIFGDNPRITKRIEQNMGVVEKMCQVIAARNDSIVVTYKSLNSNINVTEFLQILDIKGIKKTEHEAYLDKLGISSNNSIRMTIRNQIEEEESVTGRMVSFLDRLPSLKNVNSVANLEFNKK